MYPSRTVLISAHYVTIHFTDFGHYGNLKDYLDYPDLRCHIMLDESCGQYGLLIIPVHEARNVIGAETLCGDGMIIMQPVYTQMHWTELPPIHSWNLNYYRQRGETLVDTRNINTRFQMCMVYCKALNNFHGRIEN